MCGLVGGRAAKLDSNILEKMVNFISHRGPDHRAFVFFPQDEFGMGYVKLDVRAGIRANQPISNEDRSVYVFLNGEIYNGEELRRTLKNEHFFSTTSDGEILIHLYEEQGEKFLNKVDGMFALALWDSKRKRLILARDGYGTKPLYYFYKNGELWFASEVKAFFAVPGFKFKINEFALHQYLTFMDIYKGSFFESIELLEPGTMLIFEHNILKKISFWDYSFYSFKVKEQDLWKALETGVKKNLRTDAEASVFISGGIDTGIIASLSNRLCNRINGFVICYKTKKKSSEFHICNELPWAKKAAAWLGIKMFTKCIDSEWAWRNFPKLVWHLEEPRVGVSFPNLAAAQLVSEKQKRVVLSGAGGDELFAGYSWRHGIWKSEDPLSNYFRAWEVMLIPVQLKKQVYTDFFYKSVQHFDLKALFNNIWYRCPSEHPLDRIMYFDLKTFLASLLLVDDKLGMAYSVEEKFPFLTEEVVKAALSIPPEERLDAEFKKPLRKILRILLPPIASRPKTGFAAPAATWFREWGSRWDKMLRTNWFLFEYIRPEFVKESVRRHLSGERDYSRRLWAFLFLELLLRMFILKEQSPYESPFGIG